MSFLKSVEAARALVREKATPCDDRDIATPGGEPVAKSQESQSEPPRPAAQAVATSQVSPPQRDHDLGHTVAESQSPRGQARSNDTAAADRRAALMRLIKRFYALVGRARRLPWGPTNAQADVVAFHDLADEWCLRAPPGPAGDLDLCARCGTRVRCNPHGADGGSLWLCAACAPAFAAERDHQARAAVIKALREAHALDMAPDIDIAALEAAPPRDAMPIVETFDADRQGDR